AKKLKVLVIGSLTYDNEHTLKHVNGQPKRISLWELHPVLEFYVCPSHCDVTNKTDGWQELTIWAKANPH
ncbi:MAG TPA: hypothetical protein VKH42_07010, partial [Vicinamibacterales bacterium]|nr:hypothetical protein [Vicinamibacterales bacterium]